MTTTSDGPAGIKMNNRRENGESRTPPNPQLVAQEEEAHPTHSFQLCLSNKRQTRITCNKAGTVEEALKRSSQFRRDAEKHKDKELVILRDGKAISLHFPCRLIENECLILKYVKAVNKPKKCFSSRVTSRKEEPSSNLVMFHVLVKGGRNVVKILANSALKAQCQKVSVYAYKGEKVKQALQRDARFLNIIFKKNCALSERSTEVTTEMSNLVDDLDGKTFQIILLDKSSPPDGQPDSLEVDTVQCFFPDRSQDSSQQSIPTDLENNHIPRMNPKLHGVTEPEPVLHEIPGSSNMHSQLSSKSKDSVKGMKTQVPRLSHIQNLFCVEYGKNAETCRKVKTLRELVELSNSVCQVRINGTAEGSGFLLFGNLVLTSAHVINDSYDIRGQLNERVTVNFSFDDLEQPVGESIVVEEVVGYEYDRGVPPCDWALLKLSADENLPRPLLTHFGFLPKSGAICIIGHPDGGVKKVDPCLVVPTENRNQVVERHLAENHGRIQLLTSQFFENTAKSVQQQKQALTYESCFYQGSSGSPVFDKHCNVVAMHTGGYEYSSTRGKTSVIEFGYALSDVMEHMIIQMVEREKFDVLKDFLTCDFAQYNNILSNVKRLVDSRNLTVFKSVVNNSVNMADTPLKNLFEFFAHVEAPVPMEII